MLPVRPRRTPLSIELGLGAGMLVCALTAVPLGLDRIAGAPVVAAGLTLGRTEAGDGAAAMGAPPLVVLLLRLFAFVPVGDLAARANLAAVVCAVVAAALLGRLGFRIVRSLGPIDPAGGHDAASVRDPGREDAGETGSEPGGADQTQPTGVGLGEPGGWGGGLAASSGSWSETTGPFVRPTIRPQLRSVPGPTPVRSAGAPRVTPARGVAALLAAPAPTALMSSTSTGWTGHVHSIATSGPGTPAPLAHEMFALCAGVACGLGSLGTFLALTSSPAAALTLVIVVMAWLQLLALDGRPGTPRRGLALALLAGLATGADPVAPLFIWPAVALTCVRRLRQGERWPWLAPGAFAVGAAVALPWLATPSSPLAASAAAAWGAVRALATGFTSGRGLFPLLDAGREALGQWGVVAGLIALVGAAVLLRDRPRWFAFGLLSGTIALALIASEMAAGHPPGATPGSAAWVVLSALIAVPVVLGVIRLAATLGPARGAGALGLAVVACLWPLLDGGRVRFARAPGFPEALLERAQQPLAPGVVVDPGSPALTHLFRYGQAIGLRPDLQLAPGAGARAVPVTPVLPLAQH